MILVKWVDCEVEIMHILLSGSFGLKFGFNVLKAYHVHLQNLDPAITEKIPGVLS